MHAFTVHPHDWWKYIIFGPLNWFLFLSLLFPSSVLFTAAMASMCGIRFHPLICFWSSCRELLLNSQNKFPRWMRGWTSLHLVLKSWIQRSLLGEFQLVNKTWLCSLKHAMALDPLLFLRLAWGMVHWLDHYCPILHLLPNWLGSPH